MIVTPAPFHRVPHSTAKPRQLCSIYGSLGFRVGLCERPVGRLGVQADVVLEGDVLGAHLDQIDDEVVDLLVVQGALVPDAPRWHRVPALLDHLVDVVLRHDRVVRRVTERPRAKIGEVRRVGQRVARLDHASTQLGTVAPHAAHAELVLLGEGLHGQFSAVERQHLEILLLAQVGRGLDQPVVGDQDHEEGDEHHAPALQLLQQRGLEGRVGGAGPHPPRDVERLFLLPAAEVQRGAGRNHEDRRRARAAPRLRCSWQRASPSLVPFLIRWPRRTGPGVAGRSCRCRVAVRGSPRRCRRPRCRR